MHTHHFSPLRLWKWLTDKQKANISVSMIIEDVGN